MKYLPINHKPGTPLETYFQSLFYVGPRFQVAGSCHLHAVVPVPGLSSQHGTRLRHLQVGFFSPLRHFFFEDKRAYHSRQDYSRLKAYIHC
jgi:hypothetical protein